MGRFTKIVILGIAGLMAGAAATAQTYYPTVGETMKRQEQRANAALPPAAYVGHRSTYSKTPPSAVKRGMRAMEAARAAAEDGRYAEACADLRKAEQIFAKRGYDGLAATANEYARDICARA